MNAGTIHHFKPVPSGVSSRDAVHDYERHRGQSTPDWIGAKKGYTRAALRNHSINPDKLYQHLMEMSIKMQVHGDIDNPPGPLYNAGGITA
jgi:hypothetical protein